jgi:hypothetical protein
MKKFAAATLSLALLAVPAFAAIHSTHKVTHPRPVHAQNPYLAHPNHKAQRHHHKKI